METSRDLTESSSSSNANKQIRNLQLFWKLCMEATEDEVQLQWLELFLYKYQNIISDSTITTTTSINSNKHQFLSTVASQLTCITLHMVYIITNKVKLTFDEQDVDATKNCTVSNGIDHSNGPAAVKDSPTKSPATVSDKNIEAADLAKKVLNDKLTISSLREFLVNGIGGRILQFLLKCNTSHILNPHEITRLLVNLFPTNKWDISVTGELDDNVQDDCKYDAEFLLSAIELMESLDNCSKNEKDKLKIKMFQHNYAILTKQTSTRLPCRASYDSDDEKNNIDDHIENDYPLISNLEKRSPKKPQQFETNDYQKYLNRTLTCDKIASIILNLLEKLIIEESMSGVEVIKFSVTIESLNFAIDCYCSISSNEAFASRKNREHFQRKLLTIIYLCLTNVFENCRQIEDLVNFKEIIDKIGIMLEEQDKKDENVVNDEIYQLKSEHMSALIYLIFLILHKVRKRQQQLGIIDHSLFYILKPRTNDVLTILQNNFHNEKMLAKVIQVVCKLIFDIRQINSADDNVTVARRKASRRGKRRKSFKSSVEQCSHHHQNSHEYGCVLEKILLNLLQFGKAAPVTMIFRFFQRNKTCCCNGDVQFIEKMLLNAHCHRLHKEALQFVKNNFLKTIYSNIECVVCGLKKEENNNFEYEFVEVYKRFMGLLERTELLIFLKHITNISKYLPFNISIKVFVDLVLPPFRREKLLYENVEPIEGKLSTSMLPPLNIDLTKGPPQPTSKDIISSCLNVFICYLKDIRLVKGFFISENVHSMEDLLIVPEFASLICCLLKIGMEKASFLGENLSEQYTMTEKLTVLQMETIESACWCLNALFLDISATMDCASIRLKFASELGENEILPATDIINNKILTKTSSSINDVLHLNVVYWNLVLQMLRSKGQFKQKFQRDTTETGSIFNHEHLFRLAYNSLLCFLFTLKKPAAKSSNKIHKISSAANSLHLSEFSIIDLSRNSSVDNIAGQQIQNTNNCDRSYYCDFSQNCDTEAIELHLLTTSYQPNGILYDDCDIDFNKIKQTNDNNNDDDDKDDDDNDVGSRQTEEGIRSFTSDNNILFNATDLAANTFSLVYNIENSRLHHNKTTTNRYCSFAREQLINKSAEVLLGGYDEKVGGTNSANLESDLITNSVQKIQNFIANKVYDIFAFPSSLISNSNPPPTSCENASYNLNNKRIKVQVFDANELMQISTASETKKLFLQLFEIICGVMMSSAAGGDSADSDGTIQQNIDPKMQKSLNDLKGLLLKHSVTICYSIDNGTAIISALQSLLKVAEMRYSCCVVEDCAHARQSYGYNVESDSNLLSTSATKDDGTVLVDNQCCNQSQQQPKFDVNYEFSSDEDVSTTGSDENYTTADEGYDGDAEVANQPDTEEDENDYDHFMDLIKPNQPATSRYRAQIIHKGLSRIVVDILIDLSKHCLENPNFWPNFLMQIATRLSAVRESIGGSLYLIKGFTPILQCNDVRLSDFQKSLLDLITDVSTPETFQAFLKILTSDDAPVDILLPRLICLGGLSFRLQPSMEICFPTLNDESIKSTCDPVMVNEIKQIHDYHQYHHLQTALTQSAYIVPLNYINFKPWHQSGFTVTTWLQIKSLSTSCEQEPSVDITNNHQSTEVTTITEGIESMAAAPTSTVTLYELTHPSAPTANVRKKSSIDKIHLLSIGSNKLILSIYINAFDQTTLYFQLCKPNAQISDKKAAMKLTRSNTEIIAATINAAQPMRRTTKNPCSCPSFQRKRGLQKSASIHREITINENNGVAVASITSSSENENKENIESYDKTASAGLNIFSNTCQQAIKTTRIAIRNSFSQFNLFSTTENEYISFRYPLEVKGLKIAQNKWTHLSFSVVQIGKEITIRITIDGLDQHDIQLPCLQQNNKNDKIQLLCIGDKFTATVGDSNEDDSSSVVNVGDQLIEQKRSFSYGLSDMKLFQKCFLKPDILSQLVALGPDCVNLTKCQVGNLIPNIGFLNSNKLAALPEFQTNSVEALQLLRENLVGNYSADNPNIFLGYNSYENVEIGEPMGLMKFGCGAEPQTIRSFQSAVLLSGGLSTLLYLFARIVELSNSEYIQSAALAFLLKTAHSNTGLYTEFVKKDYISLIGPIIRSKNCLKGVYMLNSIFETACDMPVLSKRSEQFVVLHSTNATIVYTDLLIAVIRNYADWHTIEDDERQSSEIMDILLETIQALVREKHPRQSLNIRRLTNAGLVGALLKFCKVFLVGIPKSIYLSTKSADAIVNLISIFAGAPPTSALLDEIIKVLLLLHRPSDSFITHDRSKFYYLLSSMVMAKQKRMSLPLLSTRRISLNIRKRSNPNRHTVNISTNEETDRIIYNAKLQRSKSFGNPPNNQATTLADRRPFTSLNSENIPEKEIKTFKDEINFNASTSRTPADLSAFEAIVKVKRGHNRQGSNGFEPIDPIKLDQALVNTQLRRHLLPKKRSSNKLSGRPRNLKSSRSRSRTTTTDSETDKDSTNKSDIEPIIINEYDIVASDELKRIEDGFRLKALNLQATTMSNSCSTNGQDTAEGVLQIQNGFFRLLKDFILILPDNIVQEVLTHYVTIEIILIMANHHDASVRSSIIRLMAVMCERLTETTNFNYNKIYYWHHLGNQISLHTVDHQLLQTCCQWITGSCVNLEQMVGEKEVRITEKYGLHSVLACLPQTYADLKTVKLAFLFMEKVYSSKSTELRQYLIEIGLLPSITKTLSRFYHKWAGSNEDVVFYLNQFCCLVAHKALISTGTINVLWDLLNGLTFMEDSKTNFSVYRGFRSTQAVIMINLLNSFFLPNRGPGTYAGKFKLSDMNLLNCTLSASEKKTRFDLLIDRIVQFLTNVNPSHLQTEAETKLIESCVILAVSGCIRAGNVVPWALCPTRPITLKMYIIRNLLLYSRDGTLPSVCCDAKFVKTMTQSFYQTDREILSKSDLDILKKVCILMGISLVAMNCPLSNTLEKMEQTRDSSLRDQEPAIQRTIFKFESLVQPCIDSAMKITRDVVELQNVERRTLMTEMRAYDESGLCTEWNLIIERMTHEGAPWHSERNYPSSWELDQTEGPQRVRVRLKRCHLNVASKFFTEDSQDLQNKAKTIPLSYLQSSLVHRPFFSLSDQVLYTFACRHLPVDNEADGEIIITESHLIFLSNNLNEPPIMIESTSILEIWKRRYQHEDIGLEFFLETNTSKLFIFANSKDRDVLVTFFQEKMVQCPDQPKLLIITQQWIEGQLTNWEYLMTLNQISGRTYQDLMQYPIFPWILSDYESSTLNLNNSKSFRYLDRPIAVQHKENEVHYINNYNYLEQTASGTTNPQLLPYHFGSHYSNSGTVLHFLVRIPPFTQFFLQYQDNNFDLPDRTFHSLQTTWRLASKNSPTDVKEIIPEFFYLPEMFENLENFKFGIRQSGEYVHNVNLPPWSQHSPRLFSLIHRQALECQLVRNNLHKWINLVFGYQQTGQAAVEAVNVFHPSTYIGFSAEQIADPVLKSAMQTMVRTYGQMPKQLFKQPHPVTNEIVNTPTESSQATKACVDHFTFVKGLRWGAFCGSPELMEPTVCYSLKQSTEQIYTKLISLANTNVVYEIPEGCSVMQGSEPDTMNIISWMNSDRVIRLKPLFDNENSQQNTQQLCYNSPIDPITCCGTTPQSSQIWLGHRSGQLTVYQLQNVGMRNRKNRFFQHSSFQKMSYNSAFRKISAKELVSLDSLSSLKDEAVTTPCTAASTGASNIRWKEPIVLIRHRNEVTGIEMSNEFKIVVSISRDGFACIWDMNRLQYVRSIERPTICRTSPISLVAISPTLGDIATVHSLEKDDEPTTAAAEDSDGIEMTESIAADMDFVQIPIDLNGKSLLRLHTINAKYVQHLTIAEKCHSVCYSHMKEGTGINVIATGLEGGRIRLWSSWDLSLVREIGIDENVNIISLGFSTYQHLVTLANDNTIKVWDSVGGLAGNRPKFPQISFHKRSF